MTTTPTKLDLKDALRLRLLNYLLVPKSEGGPHRANTGDGSGRYFMRVGSTSGVAPHSLLAYMFGRQPQAKVFLRFKRHRDNMGFNLTLGNDGRGAASDVLLRFAIWKQHPARSAPHAKRESLSGFWIDESDYLDKTRSPYDHQLRLGEGRVLHSHSS